MSRRYGRAQFIRDAIWLGVPPEDAFSRAELRRRRDRLMNVHHPDRGGDAKTAARINATYARMTVWLERRDRRNPEPGGEGTADASVYKSSVAAAFHAGAAQFCAAALIALATMAAFRGKGKP